MTRWSKGLGHAAAPPRRTGLMFHVKPLHCWVCANPSAPSMFQETLQAAGQLPRRVKLTVFPVVGWKG